MDTHAPYEAPDDYQRKFLDEPVSRRRSQKLASKATHHPDELSGDEWKLQQQLYKAECRYLDDQLKRLFDSLPESVKADTVIVFTADHGEMHGKHGLGGHPQQFWEEVIHVPCSISAPGLERRTINEQIGLVDLPPTILDTIGIDAPENWDGHSVLPADGGEVREREHVFVDVEPELNREHAGVRRADNWKLMRHDDERELLLDLTTNPEEDPEENQLEGAPDQYQKLTTVLDNHLDEMERRCSDEIAAVEDEDVIEDHLKELGYLE
jgi:arylsulfatase A-like enzyme